MKQRHNQPVVTDSNNEIIWLPGLKNLNMIGQKEETMI